VDRRKIERRPKPHDTPVAAWCLSVMGINHRAGLGAGSGLLVILLVASVPLWLVMKGGTCGRRLAELSKAIDVWREQLWNACETQRSA
jgi:hypothetical protein